MDNMDELERLNRPVLDPLFIKPLTRIVSKDKLTQN